MTSIFGLKQCFFFWNQIFFQNWSLPTKKFFKVPFFLFFLLLPRIYEKISVKTTKLVNNSQVEMIMFFSNWSLKFFHTFKLVPRDQFTGKKKTLSNPQTIIMFLVVLWEVVPPLKAIFDIMIQNRENRKKQVQKWVILRPF